MKKKIRILSLCFVLLAAVTVFAVTPFAFAEDEAVTIYQNGVAVSEAVGLQDGADTVLNAVAVVADGIVPTYQWQVLADAETDSWFDLEGQSTDTIALNAAVLGEYFTNGIATIRCKASDGANDYFSKKLAVSEAPATGVQPSASDDAAAAEDTAADATGETAPATTDEANFIAPVSFTKVAPLVESVQSNQPMRAKAMGTATYDASSNNGVVLNKTVTPDGDNYKITLEAYATGETTTTTVVKPCDIVLVLDVSGSMDGNIGSGYYTYTPVYDININDTYYILSGDDYVDVYYHKATWLDKDEYWYYKNGWSNVRVTPKTSVDDTNSNHVQFYTRQYVNAVKKIDALKDAVNGFIDSVGATSPDSQIAIVKFAGDKSERIGNDMYTSGRYEYNYSQIFKTLTTVDANGVTTLKSAVSALSPAGATAADYGMEHAASILSTPAEGRNQVVVMFTDGEPNHGKGFDGSVANAAITASKALKDNGVTVYTIGCFSGADGSPDNDPGNSKVNKYMHGVSSNYPKATSYTNLGTPSFPTNGSSYYLSASSSEDLSNIFENISNETGGSTTTLTTTSVIKDTVTPYFDVPENVSDVHLYCASSTGANTDGTPNFGAREGAPTGVTASFGEGKDSRTLSVTGFDFKENWCGPIKDGSGNTTGYHNGKKLIIEFTITPREGFLGGNGVPTNVGEGDGIYDKDGNKVSGFDKPEGVDVPLKDVTFDTKTNYTYLGAYADNTVTEGNLKHDTTVTSDGVTIKLDPNEENFGLEAWQNEFVDISADLTYKDANGDYVSVPSGGITGLFEDTDFNTVVTISPKTGEGSKSTTFNRPINVFKPVITWKDSQINIGDTANYTYNFVSVAWKHGSDVDVDVKAQGEAHVVGNAPGLTYEYSSEAGAFTEDTPVKVTAVKIGSNNILQYLTDDYAMIREECVYKFPCQISEGNNFIVHVRKASVRVRYYLQNVDGNGYTEDTERSHTDANQRIDIVYTEQYPNILGFAFNETSSKYSGTVTEDGLELKLYYDRLNYPYEFRFLERDTDTVLADPVTGNALFEASVTQDAKDIFGYDLDGDSPQTINIKVEDPADKAVKNVKTFYYVEKIVNINYVAVGPSGEDFGSVTPESETVKIFNGNASGSTATAKDRYRFVGWFSDPGCTQTVTGDWINGNKITPQKTVLEGSDKERYVAATYYAKFERNVADLTITKDGWNNIDENQSFVFNVKGSDANTSTIDVDVVISFNGDIAKNSVTVSDLPVGNYIVTEKSGWSWRYAIGSVKFNRSTLTSANSGYEITLESNGGEIAFTNNRTNTGWLNGGNFAKNFFDGNEDSKEFGIDVSNK